MGLASTVATSLALGLAIAGCSGPTAEAPAGTPQFEAPVKIEAPISTDGWEDSGMVSPDGNTLHFTYLRFDPVTFIQTGRFRVIGPVRPGWPSTPPFDTVGAELYRSQRIAGQWAEPENLGPVINLPEGLEGDEWVSEDGNRILFTNGNPTAERPVQSIYYAERAGGVWSKPVLASTVGFPFVEFDENPHLTRDERTLFFESSRPGGLGKQDIWISRRVGNAWSAPENLGPNVNSSEVEGSPFSLDGQSLYWDDKGGGRGISWSFRQADGSWARSVIVLPGSFGDPSITAAGDLYLIGGRLTADGFDADIYLAKRR